MTHSHLFEIQFKASGPPKQLYRLTGGRWCAKKSFKLEKDMFIWPHNKLMSSFFYFFALYYVMLFMKSWIYLLCLTRVIICLFSIFGQCSLEKWEILLSLSADTYQEWLASPTPRNWQAWYQEPRRQVSSAPGDSAHTQNLSVTLLYYYRWLWSKPGENQPVEELPLFTNVFHFSQKSK